MTPTAIDSLVYYAARGANAVLAFQPTMTPGGGGASHPSPAAGGGAGGGLMNFIMLPAIFLFVWFFMLRPMRQQQKDQETLQKGLRKGDRVVTNGGMIGTVHEVFEKEISIELADKVRVRFLRDSVTKKYETPTADAKPAEADKK
jgi:preprotein translocase subunit YajC